jgi:hypothetical protein
MNISSFVLLVYFYYLLSTVLTILVRLTWHTYITLAYTETSNKGVVHF